MLHSNPVWKYTSGRSLTQWYGNVLLMANHAVGQWFCIDRNNGDVKWQRDDLQLNTIRGVDSNVIVASELRSDGPWTLHFGCGGIDLVTGQHIWFDSQDAPHHVVDGMVYCESGRVIDVTDGQVVETLERAQVRAYQTPQSIAQQFYDSVWTANPLAIEINNDLQLRMLNTPNMRRERYLDVAGQSSSGETLWEVSTRSIGKFIDGNFYSFRLAPPYLYMVVSDEIPEVAAPENKFDMRPHPTLWHLLTLNLSDGRLAQQIPLGEDKHATARIEDIDDEGILVSNSANELTYFRRS